MGFSDFEDFCENIRQDFDIYLNIDYQKAKILKNKQRKKIKTHKQANDQTNKQTNKQRKPHCFFCLLTSGHKGSR